jgi:hypothetical protein
MKPLPSVQVGARDANSQNLSRLLRDGAGFLSRFETKCPELTQAARVGGRVCGSGSVVEEDFEI